MLKRKAVAFAVFLGLFYPFLSDAWMIENLGEVDLSAAHAGALPEDKKVDYLVILFATRNRSGKMRLLHIDNQSRPPEIGEIVRYPIYGLPCPDGDVRPVFAQFKDGNDQLALVKAMKNAWGIRLRFDSGQSLTFAYVAAPLGKSVPHPYMYFWGNLGAKMENVKALQRVSQSNMQPSHMRSTFSERQKAREIINAFKRKVIKGKELVDQLEVSRRSPTQINIHISPQDGMFIPTQG